MHVFLKVRELISESQPKKPKSSKENNIIEIILIITSEKNKTLFKVYVPVKDIHLNNPQHLIKNHK